MKRAIAVIAIIVLTIFAFVLLYVSNNSITKQPVSTPNIISIGLSIDQEGDLYDHLDNELLNRPIQIETNEGVISGNYSQLIVTIVPDRQNRFGLYDPQVTTGDVLLSMDVAPQGGTVLMLNIWINPAYLNSSSTSDNDVSLKLSKYLHATKDLVSFNRFNGLPVNNSSEDSLKVIDMSRIDKQYVNLVERQGYEGLPVSYNRN